MNYTTTRNRTQEEKKKFDKKIKHYQCLYQFYFYTSVKFPQKDVQIESLDDLFEEPEAPMLPQEEKEELSTDIQKELEAKFDELFGSLDEENKDTDTATDAFADII